MLHMPDAAALAKRCPQCGLLLSADSLRCGYCLAEVWDVQAGIEVGPAPGEQSRSPASRRAPRLRALADRTLALPKWLLGLLVLFVAAAGWYGFQSLKPERTLASPAIR